ncbi:MAG: hypothetical protein QXG05_08780 [Nitrososphaerota archaeon]
MDRVVEKDQLFWKLTPAGGKAVDVLVSFVSERDESKTTDERDRIALYFAQSAVLLLALIGAVILSQPLGVVGGAILVAIIFFAIKKALP